MTDDTAGHVDPEDIDVETCLAQLRDPAVLLADALHRIHRADAAQAEIDGLGVPITDADCDKGIALHDRQSHLMRTGEALAYIAKAAADMAHQERQATLRAIDDGLDQLDADMESRTVPPGDLTHDYKPQAVTGVRFTAELKGARLGIVAGRDWLYVSGYGYLDISHADQADRREGMRYELSGRVVSATPEYALCITDGGTSVILPRALITESADE